MELIKKSLPWVFVTFLIFFVAYHPSDAAEVTKVLWSALSAAYTGLADFAAALAG